MANMLTDPKFAANPPVKLNVDAKIIGLVVAILAVLGAIVTLFLGGLLSLLGFAGGVAPIWLLGVLITLAGEVLGAIGGFQMYSANRRGKDLVIYGLALGLLGALVSLIGQIIAYSGVYAYIGYGGAIFGLIIDVIVYGILYYLVVISRFPGDVPLTQSPGGYGAPPPPPPA
jgi:hypothetical protein